MDSMGSVEKLNVLIKSDSVGKKKMKKERKIRRRKR